MQHFAFATHGRIFLGIFMVSRMVHGLEIQALERFRLRHCPLEAQYSMYSIIMFLDDETLWSSGTSDCFPRDATLVDAAKHRSLNGTRALRVIGIWKPTYTLSASLQNSELMIALKYHPEPCYASFGLIPYFGGLVMFLDGIH